jgi:hypothetical protein
MTNEMRSAVVQYCNIGVGNEMSGVTKLQNPLHPRLRAVYNKLLPDFVRLIIIEHNLLSQERHRKKFLDYLDPATRNIVASAW